MNYTIDDVKKRPGICMVQGCVRNEYKNELCRICYDKNKQIKKMNNQKCSVCGWVPPVSSYLPKGKNNNPGSGDFFPQSRVVKKVRPTTENPHGRLIWKFYHYCPDHGEYEVKEL